MKELKTNSERFFYSNSLMPYKLRYISPQHLIATFFEQRAIQICSIQAEQ